MNSPDPETLSRMEEAQIFAYLAETDHPNWTALEKNSSFDLSWVAYFLNRKRHIPPEKIRDIYRTKNLTKSYAVNHALVRCKFTPVGIAANVLSLLRSVDLLKILREPYVQGNLRPRIEKQIMDRFPNMPLGEKIVLAKQAPRGLIRQIRLSPDQRVIRALLSNYFFTYEDAIFLANYPKIRGEILAELTRSAKWMHHKQLRLDLLANPRLPAGCIPPLIRGFTPFDVQQLLKKPNLRPVVKMKLKQFKT